MHRFQLLEEKTHNIFLCTQDKTISQGEYRPVKQNSCRCVHTTLAMKSTGQVFHYVWSQWRLVLQVLLGEVYCPLKLWTEMPFLWCKQHKTSFDHRALWCLLLPVLGLFNNFVLFCFSTSLLLLKCCYFWVQKLVWDKTNTLLCPMWPVGGTI